MDVGVHELKAHLSEYVARAAEGEAITITDRGRPAAMLVPLPGRAALERGIEAGWITAPTMSLLPVRRRSRAPRRVLDVLAEDRGG